MDNVIKTYGEFIKLVRKTDIVDTLLFFDKWLLLAGAAKTAETNFSVPLTKELVLAFAFDASIYFSKRVANTNSESLCQRLHESGCAFQKEIFAKAVGCGIEVGLEEIRMPLRFIDAPGKSGGVRGIRFQV
jgi:hypothetical protein